MPRFLLSPFASKRQINTFLIRSDIFVFGRPLTLPIRTLQPRCAAQLGAGWNANPVGVDCGLIILPRKNYAVATSSPDGALRWLSKNRGVSCFSGFPYRDASLRNEGCFFLVPAGRSLLRSTTVPERNRGRSPCITARVFPVFVGTICHFLALRSLRLGERKSPTDSRMGINPTPTGG